MLEKISDSSTGKLWYKILAEAEFALNNTVHSTTGATPSKMLFGINQRGKLIDPVAEYLEQTKHSKSNRDLEQVRSEIIEKNEKSQEYNKAYYGKNHKEPRKYQVGDYVMVRNYDTTVGASIKRILRFKGPYEVTKVLRNDRYVLQDV